MTTLTLYQGRQKVAEWPISPNQVWEVLGEALNAWARSTDSPRVVLSDGKVAHLIKMGGGNV